MRPSWSSALSIKTGRFKPRNISRDFVQMKTLLLIMLCWIASKRLIAFSQWMPFLVDSSSLLHTCNFFLFSLKYLFRNISTDELHFLTSTSSITDIENKPQQEAILKVGLKFSIISIHGLNFCFSKKILVSESVSKRSCLEIVDLERGVLKNGTTQSQFKTAFET